MSFIVKHKATTFDDISDYVVSSDLIPYISRNRDGSIRIESFNMNIAQTIETLRGSSYVFPNDSEIAIYDDATFVFHGYIKESNYNYSTREHELTIENAIGKLRTSSGNLYGSFSTAGKQWYEYIQDYQVQHIIGITFLISSLFDYMGFTLDKTVETDTMFTDNSGFRTGLPATVRYYEVLTYEAMVFCAGMDFATGGEYGYGYTVFDLVNELCNYMGLTVVQTEVDNFKLIKNDHTIYTVRDSNKFSYQAAYKAPDTFAFSVVWRYNDTITNYSGLTQTAFNKEIVSGTGEEDDTLFLNNVYLFWTDDAITPYTGTGIPPSPYGKTAMQPIVNIVSNAHPANSWNPILRKCLSNAFNYLEETIEAPYTLTQNPVIENFIDLRERKSRIVQEDYAI